MAALFAATHPDRTQALVLYATFSRADLGARTTSGRGRPRTGTPRWR